MGKVTVDTRPSNDDPIGVVTWWWMIDGIAARPGRYDWQVFVNGQTIGGPHWANKDDNLHFAVRRYNYGRYVYNHGDTFHVDAAHAVGGNLYVTPINQCRIP